MDSGWIKLHRSLKEWEWYDDKNATRLLVHLLISVNYEDKLWKGILIKAGSMVVSWDKLSAQVSLTVQECRTAMNKLKKSREVTTKPTNKYQVVTLVKWNKLQLDDNDINKQLNRQVNNQTTNNQQTINRQLTTTKEYKEYKKERNEEVEIIFDNILMSEIELIDLKKTFFDKDEYLKYFNIAEKFRLLFIKNLEEKNSPSKNQKEGKYKNYVTPIRLMFEKDEITREQLLKVYNFLNGKESESANFSWKTNILSIGKLREKFQQLSSKANEKSNSKNSTSVSTARKGATYSRSEALNKAQT